MAPALLARCLAAIFSRLVNYALIMLFTADDPGQGMLCATLASCDA